MLLGFLNYNPKFIQDYSKKIVFWTKLIANDFIWSQTKNNYATLEKLQEAYIAKLVLKIFNIKKPIKFKTNISNLAIEIYFT